MLATLFCLFATLLLLPGDQPVATVDPDELLLREAHIDSTADGLIAFLQRSSGRDEDLQNLDQLLRDLGNNSFSVRQRASKQLIALGTPALAGLGKALTDRDKEVVQRARTCLEEIEKNVNPGLHWIAVRRLVPMLLPKALE